MNKFLAKIASGMDKPNGLFLIPPEQAEAFIEQLPIEKFYGVGAVTATKMHKLGIQTGADLKQWSEADLVKQFGKTGRFYYRIVRAQDDRPVEPNRIRKSIGVENSFAVDLSDRHSIDRELRQLAHTLKERLDRSDSGGRTLTVKLKYADYQQITRSKTVPYTIRDVDTIMSLAMELLAAIELEDKTIRLLGLAVSHLENQLKHEEYEQLTLQF